MSEYFVSNIGKNWCVRKRSTGQVLAFRSFYAPALELAAALDKRGEIAIFGRAVPLRAA